VDSSETRPGTNDCRATAAGAAASAPPTAVTGAARSRAVTLARRTSAPPASDPRSTASDPVNSTWAPGCRRGFVQRQPVPPTAIAVAPDEAASPVPSVSAVVPGGAAKATMTSWAGSVPSLVRVAVKVTVPSVGTRSGAARRVSDRPGGRTSVGRGNATAFDRGRGRSGAPPA